MEYTQYQPQDFKLPELPKEAKEKLEAMKSKLDKFSKAVTKENKDIMGIALLPPSRISPEEKLSNEEVEKLKKRKDIILRFIKKENEVDENIFVTVMDIAEIRENCFDAKYEILEMIAAGAALYDPKDFLGALKISEVHKNMTLKKFDKYIVSYVAVGSLFRGDATSNDIDVAVVIDDTDVKKMTRIELKDRLMAIIRGMGYDASQITGVKKAH